MNSELVIFDQYIRGTKVGGNWVCRIGGIEFSGESKKELLKKSIQLLEKELIRLKEGG